MTAPTTPLRCRLGWHRWWYTVTFAYGASWVECAGCGRRMPR